MTTWKKSDYVHYISNYFLSISDFQLVESSHDAPGELYWCRKPSGNSTWGFLPWDLKSSAHLCRETISPTSLASRGCQMSEAESIHHRFWSQRREMNLTGQAPFTHNSIPHRESCAQAHALFQLTSFCNIFNPGIYLIIFNKYIWNIFNFSMAWISILPIPIPKLSAVFESSVAHNEKRHWKQGRLGRSLGSPPLSSLLQCENPGARLPTELCEKRSPVHLKLEWMEQGQVHQCPSP